MSPCAEREAFRRRALCEREVNPPVQLGACLSEFRVPFPERSSNYVPGELPAIGSGQIPEPNHLRPRPYALSWF